MPATITFIGRRVVLSMPQTGTARTREITKSREMSRPESNATCRPIDCIEWGLGESTGRGG